jgi:hypothetical protein
LPRDTIAVRNVLHPGLKPFTGPVGSNPRRKT